MTWVILRSSTCGCFHVIPTNQRPSCDSLRFERMQETISGELIVEETVKTKGGVIWRPAENDPIHLHPPVRPLGVNYWVKHSPGTSAWSLCISQALIGWTDGRWGVFNESGLVLLLSGSSGSLGRPLEGCAWEHQVEFTDETWKNRVKK